jgi:CxxC-x17-CxxC domain-containing protein
MENHRDEHIVCADCGASFLFSAGEATVFQERGLAAPKRCKDCRRARKDRASADSRGPRPPRPHAGGFQNGAHDAGPPRGPRADGGPRARGGFRNGAVRSGPPRYTGDVNEYRSPMQDGNSWQQPQWQGYGARPAGWQQPQPQQRAPRRGGPGIYRHDEYRAPSGQAEGLARADRPRRDGGAPRNRPQAEMFSITCNSCGVAAEVPFKPAEGREVFCQACYRARKPPV